MTKREPEEAGGYVWVRFASGEDLTSRQAETVMPALGEGDDLAEDPATTYEADGLADDADVHAERSNRPDARSRPRFRIRWGRCFRLLDFFAGCVRVAANADIVRGQSKTSS